MKTLIKELMTNKIITAIGLVRLSIYSVAELDEIVLVGLNAKFITTASTSSYNIE